MNGFFGDTIASGGSRHSSHNCPSSFGFLGYPILPKNLQIIQNLAFTSQIENFETNYREFFESKLISHT